MFIKNKFAVSSVVLALITLSPICASASAVSQNSSTNVTTTEQQTASTSNNYVEDNQNASGENNINPNNITVANDFVPYSSTQLNLRSTHKYKNGVNKVVKHGNKGMTVYISKSNAKLIISGAGVVIGGYTKGTLGVILGLAGLAAQNSIKGGSGLELASLKGR
ncbi:hypothetical protein A6F53_00025 [Levilactobacillus brevis]|uniref:hypothetical protein n=1 Tax=Levilactobacillus brevis TaxID=1580 RepID=UPI000465FD41|nr:hypothetical protein [Levilactobacillus brevis]ANN47732.1 hypothetical protein A6F53_00025 [Levilactobacillus brevis]ATU70669.1 hypothetical protein CT113_10175 [Levilactobacillus brevis]